MAGWDRLRASQERRHTTRSQDFGALSWSPAQLAGGPSDAVEPPRQPSSSRRTQSVR